MFNILRGSACCRPSSMWVTFNSFLTIFEACAMFSFVLHSKAPSKYNKESASNFVLSLNIPLLTLFGWFRRLSGTVQWAQHKIKVWHKCFKDGQESVENDPRSGRPAVSRTPENVERVRAAIHKNWWLTLQELEADLGIPETTCSSYWHRILAWNVSWQMCSMASATRAEGTSCCSC